MENQLLNSINDTVKEIKSNINEVKDRLVDVEKVQVRHEINLVEHMKRSESAEKRLDKFETDIKPILSGAKGLGLIVTFLASLATILHVWLLYKAN